MRRFRSIVGLFIVVFKVLWCGNSQGFQLSFITWPNETQVVVNKTVTFLWKYYVKDTDVDIKWGTSTYMIRSVAKFKEIFFIAKNYEKNGEAKMSTSIPDRYRDRVRIVDQASLQIVNVSMEDEGDYLCEIREKGGWKTLSRAVTLKVLIPPNIESHPPETILLSEDEKLTVSCKASGTPVPVVSWYRDGRELIQGEGSSQYINEGVKRGDDGNYMCVAKNNASQDQFTVQVIVQYKPVGSKIKTDAKSDTIRKGGDLKIVCEAHSKPLPTYMFHHQSDDGVKKPINNDQAAESGELYIRNVKASDRGNYSCIPQNSVGEGLEAKVRVSVLFAPEIVKLFPPKLNLTKHDALKLSCEADGFPTPSITWTREGKRAERNKNKKHIREEYTKRAIKSIFEKKNVDENDAGVYVCTASNGNLPVARERLRVNVFYKPIIDIGLASSVYAQIGDSVELKCISKGNPTPSFEWRKDERRGLGIKSTFIIKSITKNNFGEYKCVVSNSVGTTYHTIKLVEVDEPLVSDLRVTHKNGRSARISWKLVWNKLFRIRSHVISYTLDNNKENQEKNVTLVPNIKNTYKIKNLSPYSNYVVRVVACNQFVACNEAVVRFKTESARPGAPGPPELQKISPTSIRVNWLPPTQTNGEIVKYILEYSTKNDTSILEISGHETSYVLKNLGKAKTYRFRVRAVTKAGNGNFTKYVIFLNTSSTPRDMKVNQTATNIFVLQWKRPENMLGKTVKVLVFLEWKIRHTGHYGHQNREIFVGKRLRSRWSREVSFDWKAKIKQLSPIRKLELKDLFPNTDYSVSLKEGMEVKRRILWSNKSKPVVITTPEGMPSQPTGLTIDIQSDTSFLLTWKRPIYSGGKLMKYVVSYRTSTENWIKKELNTDLKNETVTTTLDRLEINARYEVKVQAIGHKYGLFSNTVELMQDSKLLKLTIGSSTDSFTLKWSKPSISSLKITKYTVFYRKKNGKWMSKDITSGLNNDTLSVKVDGLSLEALYQVKLQARSRRRVFLSKVYDVISVIPQARKDDETDYVPMFGGIIAGVLIFAFVIIVVAMFVRYNYRKRQRSQRRQAPPSRPIPGVLVTQENGLAQMSSPSEYLSSDSPGSEKYLRTEKRGNSVQVPLKLLGGTKPIPVSNLLEYSREHRKDGNKGFSEEFKTIDSGVSYPYEECKKAVNKSKNRYANIVTFDHTRVCLSKNGDNGSDYINANYVDGYNCREKFIATQGPVTNTFKDFWKMIWEQNCAAIVMVTNLMEKGKVKCQKYWPVTEPELFGSLTVNPIEEWELTDYTIRKFQLQQNNNPDLIRDVTQFQYTAWPDHGVPTHPTRLLAFIRRVQNYFRISTGKIVVHCSAGVGRSGTFIALDALLDKMKAEGVVDVYGFVSHMRTQRNSMVQTEAQYSFIYEAILEASICGETEIAVPDFTEQLELLEKVDLLDQRSLITKEFENINILSVDEKETCVHALMPENREKNRFNSIIPYDSNRVKLWPYPNEKGSDYLNATFVDGYRDREMLIATQAPLKESTEDFWRMVWEYECYVLIMLNNLVEDEVQCTQYWPSQGEEYIVFGLLMIELETEQELDSYTKRTLKCTNTKSGEERKIYHLHYTAWLNQGVPASASSVLNLIKDLLKLELETGNGLTVVHCSDGSGRSGTLITLYIALERLKLENIIDVFSIVRNLRTQRVGMIENQEQYRFCYHTLQEYTKSSKHNPKLK